MAVGADFSLPRARGASVPAVQGAPSYGAAPPRVNDRAVQSMANNQLVSGAGTRESALQSMDRAGVSRGRGQQYRADMAQAMADEDGRTAAAGTEQGAEMANRSARQAFDNTMANERLAYGGLLQGLRGNALGERAAQMGWQQSLYEAIRNGQFQLNSQQLDYSPFVNSLFR